MIYQVLVIAFLLIASTAHASAQGKDEAALKPLAEKLVNAQLAFDLKSLDAILASDYVEISPIGEIDPRAKVMTFYTPEAKAASGMSSVKSSVVIESTRVYEKTAVMIATLNYEITPTGKPTSSRSMRATLVCRKEGGEWKLSSVQYTGIRKPTGT